jgi:hypothetical protein
MAHRDQSIQFTASYRQSNPESQDNKMLSPVTLQYEAWMVQIKAFVFGAEEATPYERVWSNLEFRLHADDTPFFF